MDWGLFKQRGGFIMWHFEVDQMRSEVSRFSKRSDMFIYAAYAGLVLFNFSLRFNGAMFAVAPRHRMLSFEVPSLQGGQLKTFK